MGEQLEMLQDYLKSGQNLHRENRALADYMFYTQV